MSREFGSYGSGYLHEQIDTAANDLANGREETTRAWAGFMRVFHDVAYAVCSSEACDSSESRSIMASIDAIPRLRAELDKIESRLRPFKDCMEDAVKKALEKEGV
jgi:hypothetical protein